MKHWWSCKHCGWKIKATENPRYCRACGRIAVIWDNPNVAHRVATASPQQERLDCVLSILNNGAVSVVPPIAPLLPFVAPVPTASSDPENPLSPLPDTLAKDLQHRVRDQRLHPREKYRVWFESGRGIVRAKWTKLRKSSISGGPGRAARNSQDEMYQFADGDEVLDTDAVYKKFLGKIRGTGEHADLVRMNGVGEALLGQAGEGFLIWVAHKGPAGIDFYSHVCKEDRVHHTTFMGDGDKPAGVLAAGEWVVRKGKLIAVNGCSGHYRPKIGELLAGLDAMLKAGMVDQETTVRLWDNTNPRYVNLPVKRVLLTKNVLRTYAAHEKEPGATPRPALPAAVAESTSESTIPYSTTAPSMVVPWPH